ncbi:hypothetical protein EDB83DRAFT_1024020 [Lactarius deliciosus]|nr:hypothetical protein EDB83DRAFT_1024020 [Lactarius deliciosus]
MTKYDLWFFVEGKDTYHRITIFPGQNVADLKDKIHKVGSHGYWNGVNAMELVLLQVDIDPTPHEGNICELQAPDDARVMDRPMARIQELWPHEPTEYHLHICVRLPSEISIRKRKAEDKLEYSKSPNLVRIVESLLKLVPSASGLSGNMSNELQAAWGLYRVMWGQPLPVVETVHGQQDMLTYVPSERLRELGLKWLGFDEDVLLIRPEYITAFGSLDLGPSMQRKDSVVVIGHPGIGKTSFLYYVLLRRLSSKSPTAFQLLGGSILFDASGPREFSGTIPEQTLALTDSSTADNMEPCNAFQTAAKAQVVRIIQTTSPAKKNWKRWHKNLKAARYVMDYFSSEEIDTLGKILDLNCDKLQRIYNTWGPSTRTCVNLTRYPSQEADYVIDVEDAVEDFVRTFQHSYIDPFEQSHKIVSVRPRGEERSCLTAQVATRRIEKIILLCTIKTEVAEQILFYKMLGTHRWFGSSAGCILKTYVLACLSAYPASKPLPCIAAESGPSTLGLEIPVSRWKRSFAINSAASLKEVDEHAAPFCLIPASQNFTAFDAIVCSQDSFFTIQVTVSSTHSANLDNFENIRREVPSFLKNRKWYHVFVTNNQIKAEGLRNQKRKDLPGEIVVCSAVFDIDQLGSIHRRLIEMSKEKGGDMTDTKEKIIHGYDEDENDSDIDDSKVNISISTS